LVIQHIDSVKVDWTEINDGVKMLVLRNEKNNIRALLEFGSGKGYEHHIHPEGEEVFVINGVYSDDGKDYQAGSYLYYPPGSDHAPTSKEGCTIMVIMTAPPKKV